MRSQHFNSYQSGTSFEEIMTEITENNSVAAAATQGQNVAWL